MKNLLTLKKDENIIISSQVFHFEKPDFVYIPLPKEASITVKEKEHVLIGTPLYKIKEEVTTSPVSGIVKELAQVNTFKESISALKIINDYEERSTLTPIHKKSINKIANDHILKILTSNFNLDLSHTKNLILNSLDDEPYVLTENFYLFLHYEEYLELLDRLAKIFNIENIILCVKSSSGENLNNLMTCLGMYPNITLHITPDLYLLSKSDFLLDHLNLPKENSTVIKASTLDFIYNLIVRNRLNTTKLITISGDAVENPAVVKVKIGSSLQDILDSLFKLKSEDVLIYANGLMQGKVINLKDFIITSDIDSFIITFKEEPKKESTCLNCGLCSEICPVNLNPLYFSDANYLIKAKEKCLNCGLCSYICPVYINFNKYLREDSNE